MRATIPGEPPVCHRARAVARGGHARVYSDPRTVADEERVAVAFAGIAKPPPDVPLLVVITAVYARPATRPRAVPPDVWRAGARVRKASKPDADNIAKAVLDGLQRHGWLDNDARCTPRIERWRGAPGEAAHTVVEVSVLPWVGG